MNLRTSRIASLKQSRPCAFCGERIRIKEPATLVVRDYFTFRKAFDYIHPGCSIAFRMSRSGKAYEVCGGAPKLWRPMLYPSDTPTSTFRMDSAFVRAMNSERTS